jgi:hypothetical protein
MVQIGTATELTKDGGNTGSQDQSPHIDLTIRLKNLRIRSAENQTPKGFLKEPRK